MPVIEISALPPSEAIHIPSLIGKLACTVAGVLGIPETSVWCTWHDLRPGYFTEGSNTATRQPQATHPPIVHLTMFEGRSPELIERVITTIAAEVQAGLSLPTANVFITYHEARSGQLFAGGRLRTR